MHDKRNKDKGWREFPSSGEKRSGRKGGLSAWPEQDIRDFFPPEQPPGERSFQRGVNGIFSRYRGADFRQLGAGQEAGRYVPFGKKDIPDRASGSVRIRVSDFPAVSAIGKSRRAGPLAGGIPIPPAPERPGEPRA
ncbi:MAG: hypothetical protein C6P37_07530 [Caldibacillus debilis]|uniref:Uncharacterized protein n=1 Tax=Caldibacillus debilis TaxID=301148 RepID=A0A3E0K5J6_9BACI|nr:hypothetical protein [Bacillaceae bacterium]REJ29074.1 MAG: hypothetical protein C6P37_07530 [Caldibacillus debilis]